MLEAEKHTETKQPESYNRSKCKPARCCDSSTSTSTLNNKIKTLKKIKRNALGTNAI